jgi:hypothetical protein
LHRKRVYILRKFNVKHVHEIEYYNRMVRRQELFKAEEFVANLTKSYLNSFEVKDVKEFMLEHWKIPSNVFYKKYYPLICISEKI